MSFREFVNDTLDALEATAANARNRDLTPMVHLELPDGRREIVAVDHRFFTEDGGVEQLVAGFVVPLIQQHDAIKVAWTFTSSFNESTRAVTAIVIDREVSEVWAAFLDDRSVGEWNNLGTNTTQGLLIEPVQEALR